MPDGRLDRVAPAKGLAGRFRLWWGLDNDECAALCRRGVGTFGIRRRGLRGFLPRRPLLFGFHFFFFISHLSTSSQPLWLASLPSSTRLRKSDDLFGHFFRRLCLGQHRGICSGVERIARREELAHTSYRVITHQNGTGSRIRRATCCHLGSRLQINEIPA